MGASFFRLWKDEEVKTEEKWSLKTEGESESLKTTVHPDLSNGERGADEVLSEVRRVSERVAELAQRFDFIESMLRSLLVNQEKGREKNETESSHVGKFELSPENQASPHPVQTYAQIAAKPIVKPETHSSTKTGAILASQKTVSTSNHKERRRISNDVTQRSIFSTNVDENRKNNNRRLITESNEENLPRVGVVCNSIMKGVSFARLGQSYEFSARTQNARDTSQVSRAAYELLREGSLEAIVFHTGINDLRDPNSDPKKLGTQ
jgi:hypothetical protein